MERTTRTISPSTQFALVAHDYLLTFTACVNENT